MRRVATMYCELGVVKISSKNFNRKTPIIIFFIFCLIPFMYKWNRLSDARLLKNTVKNQHVNGFVSPFSNSYNIHEPYPLNLNTRI